MVWTVQTLKFAWRCLLVAFSARACAIGQKLTESIGAQYRSLLCFTMQPLGQNVQEAQKATHMPESTIQAFLPYCQVVIVIESNCSEAIGAASMAQAASSAGCAVIILQDKPQSMDACTATPCSKPCDNTSQIITAGAKVGQSLTQQTISVQPDDIQLAHSVTVARMGLPDTALSWIAPSTLTALVAANMPISQVIGNAQPCSCGSNIDLSTLKHPKVQEISLVCTHSSVPRGSELPPVLQDLHQRLLQGRLLIAEVESYELLLCYLCCYNTTATALNAPCHQPMLAVMAAQAIAGNIDSRLTSVVLNNVKLPIPRSANLDIDGPDGKVAPVYQGGRNVHIQLSGDSISEIEVAFITEIISGTCLGKGVQSFSVRGQLRVSQNAESSLAQAIAALPNLKKVQEFVLADFEILNGTAGSSTQKADTLKSNNSLGILGATVLLHRMLHLMQDSQAELCRRSWSDHGVCCNAEAGMLRHLHFSGLPLGVTGCQTLYSGLAAAEYWNVRDAQIVQCSLQRTNPGAQGCQALAHLLGTPPLTSLQHMDLSENDIDDKSFSKLSGSLFACYGVVQHNFCISMGHMSTLLFSFPATLCHANQA
jgi:hypothetical protein